MKIHEFQRVQGLISLSAVPKRFQTFHFKILTIKGKTRNCLKDVERRRKSKDPTHRLRQPGFVGKSQQDKKGLICGVKC